MDYKYQVFCDDLSGMTWCPVLNADTLEECVQNITEGTVGRRMPSQNYMYYIYTSHEKKVPYWGATVDFFRYVKAIAGKNVTANRKVGLQYALTAQHDMTWVFTDKPFN